MERLEDTDPPKFAERGLRAHNEDVSVEEQASAVSPTTEKARIPRTPDKSITPLENKGRNR